MKLEVDFKTSLQNHPHISRYTV